MASPYASLSHDVSPYQLSLWLVCIATLSIGSYIIYQLTLSPLASIPGPKLAQVSRAWITKHSWQGDMHRVMITLHEKHGKLVRTGPNELSISDLGAIKTIYGAGTKFKKSKWYSVWQGHRKFDLFAERDERIHGSQRRLVSRAYAMDSIKELESFVDAAVQKFMVEMEARREQIIDMGQWVQLFAFDVIGAVTFSELFGFMDAGRDDGSFRSIETALRSAAWLGQLPWVYWTHDFLLPIFGNHLGIGARHGGLRAKALSSVNARKHRGSDSQDILSKLLRTQNERPKDFDDNAVTSMATSNIFAGSDTTAISTRAIIYHLLRNPRCEEKLLEEIKSMKEGRDPNHLITLAEAESMPYLQAIMYEALRLHPAVGMSLPRVVPRGGATIDGHYLPAGTVVGVNPWVVHRNKSVFGDDVETFRPERWLGDDKGDLHRSFFAFGSGARMCLGRNISWMEMSKLIPSLFLRFEISLTDPRAELTERCWWFVMQEGLHVKLKLRAS